MRSVRLKYRKLGSNWGAAKTMERLRKPKRRPIRKRPKRGGRRAELSALMAALSQEFYNVITDTVLALGATPAEQRRALDRATRSKSRLRPSRMVLKNQMGISLLIAMWRRDARYTQPDGAPRVLSIHGRGATLESLVKRCALRLPVDEVVKMLCTQSDVRKLNGDKVALLGNPVSIMKQTPATSLAWTITQIRHLAETCVFNARVPADKKRTARFERQVYGALPKKKFDGWAQAVRQRLQKASDEVEDDLGRQDPELLTGKDKICGIGLFIFREDGDLG